MKEVFIVHGFGGIPNGGWFPWLMGELAKRNIFACSLPMPQPESPEVSEWVNTMQSYIGEPEDEIFLVGHSLGAPAVLRYLESLKEGQSIGGALLVSGFIEPLDTENSNSEYRKIDKFVVPKINFEKIKNLSKKFVVMHGSLDAVVPFSHAEKISRGLNCKLVKVEGGSHFSQKTEPICYELPEALEVILEMLK